MLNPLTSNLRHLIYYLGFWTVIAAVHILFLIRQFEFPWIIPIVDGLLYNYTFALLGLGLWYLVRYSNWDDKDPLFIIANLAAGGLLLIALWISSNELILEFFFNENQKYLEFSEKNRFWRVSLGFFFYALLILLYYLIIYYARLQEKKSSEAELQRNITQARIDLIRNLINPHFLFNSLNSISALALQDGQKAREMIQKLSDFLRFSLSKKPEDMIPLREELEIAGKYLEIEKIRFGEKLNIQRNIDDNSLGIEVPNMLLQPLFENIVKHAVQEALSPVVIQLMVAIKNDILVIELTNSLEEQLPPKKGTSFGHKHLRERLGLIYGDKARCSFQHLVRSYEVSIELPLHY